MRTEHLLAAVLFGFAVAGCGSSARPLAKGFDGGQLRLDRTQAAIGQPIRLTLTVVHAGEVRWPDLQASHGLGTIAADRTGDLYCVAVEKPIRSGDRHALVSVWEAFDSGRQTLPPLTIETDGEPVSIVTPSATIAIRSSLGWLDRTPAPLIREVPLRLPWGLWLLGAIIAAAAGLRAVERIAGWAGGYDRTTRGRLAELRNRHRDGEVTPAAAFDQAIMILRDELVDRGVETAQAMTESELLACDPVLRLAPNDRAKLAECLVRSESVRYRSQVATLADARLALAAVGPIVGLPADRGGDRPIPNAEGKPA